MNRSDADGGAAALSKSRYHSASLPADHGYHDRERLSDRLGLIRLRRFRLPARMVPPDPLYVALVT